VSALIGCHPEVLFQKIFLGRFLSLVALRGCFLFAAWGGITVGHKDSISARRQQTNKQTKSRRFKPGPKQKTSFLFNLNYSYFSYFITSFINILTTDIPTLYIYIYIYIFSRYIFYFHFSTYDVAYAQFHQNTVGSLKMALLQRRNM
jgi:hypothetical protein